MLSFHQKLIIFDTFFCSFILLKSIMIHEKKGGGGGGGVILMAVSLERFVKMYLSIYADLLSDLCEYSFLIR